MVNYLCGVAARLYLLNSPLDKNGNPKIVLVTPIPRVLPVSSEMFIRTFKDEVHVRNPHVHTSSLIHAPLFSVHCRVSKTTSY